ncbi:MAG: Ig-like domain-containing protein [Gammaproteobacteria bacterium]
MKKVLIAAAMLVVSTAANAATYSVTLTDHLIGRANNAPSASLINPAPTGAGDPAQIPMPTFTYNDVTGELAATGVLNVRSQTNPTANGRVFDRYVTDLNIVASSPAATTAFRCENSPASGTAAGGFGAVVGANICGNYTLGSDFVDNSTLTYSGLTHTRVLSGDDVASGPEQSIDNYELAVVSFTGTGGELVLQSADWLPQPQSPANSQGTQLKFTVGAVIPTGPEATDDTANTPQDVPVTIDVLANDTGLTDTPITVAITTNGTLGTATVNGSPGDPSAITVTYTPNPGATGQDTFVYTVTDNSAAFDTATVTVDITPLGANDDTATTTRNTPVDISVMANDVGFSDPVTVTIGTAPGAGTATVAGSGGPQAAVRITYTPNAGAVGADTFTYIVDDGVNPAATATVSVTVTNITPTAAAGAIAIATAGVDPSTATGTFNAATGNTLGNLPAVVTVSTQGTKGAAVVSGTTITYTPSATFFAGTDTFDYTITDKDGETATATVTVTIADATPTVAGGTATGDEGTVLNATGAFTAGNGTAAQHTLSVSTAAASGACVASISGSNIAVAYTPNAGFTGNDSLCREAGRRQRVRGDGHLQLHR